MSDIDIPYEIRLKYLERRKTDLQECKTALLKNDFDTFIRVGHQVKGNASTYGFDDLGTIAIHLEDSALHKDIPNLKSGLLAFEKFLDEAKVER